MRRDLFLIDKAELRHPTAAHRKGGSGDRRAFLQKAGATTGAVLLAGPLQSFLAGTARAERPERFTTLGPVPDLRDGRVRIHLPPGFQYRSFHDTDGPAIFLPDGTQLPGRHDGMGTFPAADGNVWLTRAHQRGGIGPVMGPGDPYDPGALAGTTTVLVTPFGEVLDAFTSLNGTLLNSQGGRMPWGSWITCEETVNGPDVGPDFTSAPNTSLQEPHGFLFEVPPGGQSTREPITSAGRFLHEAAAFDPDEGILYLTEDNFEFPSGFYRYIPPVNPMTSGSLENGGRLQMLRVVGQPNANLAVAQTTGTTVLVDWVDIADPAPTFATIVTNYQATLYVGDQGRARGAAYFSRLEGATYTQGEIYFTSTQGGGPMEATFGPILTGYGNGTGQLWSYDPRAQTLTCRFQSPGASVLDLPDAIATRTERGTIVLCEDGPGDNYIRGLTREGALFDIALNRLTTNATNLPRHGEEFAGATFSPDGHTLFVNIQAFRGITFAIWGPWGRLGV